MDTTVFSMRLLVVLIFGYIELVQCQKAIDLVFTIDVTASVDGTRGKPRPEYFGYIQQFIKNMAQGFNISILETQIGVLTFNNVIHIQTELTPNRNAFENAVQNSRNHCCREKAKTNLALVTTDKVFARSSRDVTSSKIVVLITDSPIHYAHKKTDNGFKESVQRLNGAGINIIIIDISSKSDKELKEAASHIGNKYFLKKSFSELQDKSLMSEIRDQISQAHVCYCYDLADCNKETGRCVRIKNCEQKYYYRDEPNSYAACCYDKVCGNGFTCDHSKKECKAPHPTPSSSNRSIAAVVVVLLLFLVIVTVVTLFFKKYKKKKKKVTIQRPPHHYVNSQFRMYDSDDVYYSPAALPSRTLQKKPEIPSHYYTNPDLQISTQQVIYWSAAAHSYSALQKTPIQVYAKLISSGEKNSCKRSPAEAHHYRESDSEVKLLKIEKI